MCKRSNLKKVLLVDVTVLSFSSKNRCHIKVQLRVELQLVIVNFEKSFLVKVDKINEHIFEVKV